jgi:hypothetical protein
MAITGVIHDRLQQDITLGIQALNLLGSKNEAGQTITGDIGANVLAQFNFDESNVMYPCVVLTCEDEIEEDDETTSFEEDGVIYPVRILICDRVSTRWQDSRPDYQRWRWTIQQWLLGLPAGVAPGATFFPDVPECWDIRLRRLKIFDAKLPQYQFMVSGFVALCRTMTPRWRGGVQPI